VAEALRVSEAGDVSSPHEPVGRDRELALAAAAVRELSEGQASALSIEREAGIGKTRLVQSIVDDARSRGSRSTRIYAASSSARTTDDNRVALLAPLPAGTRLSRRWS
jgi:hypothetical protein